MPNDLHAICEELRQIGLNPETPAARAKLEKALSSKWDGVQVAAAKALSRWGDQRSVRSLKELLSLVASKPNRNSTTHGVVKALYPHIKSSDLDWVIDVFVRGSRADNRGWIAMLFGAFPANEVRRRLAAEKLHGGKLERDVRAEIFCLDSRISRERKRLNVRPDDKKIGQRIGVARS